jgi:flagellar biogenesis protein FliO
MVAHSANSRTAAHTPPRTPRAIAALATLLLCAALAPGQSTTLVGPTAPPSPTATDSAPRAATNALESLPLGASPEPRARTADFSPSPTPAQFSRPRDATSSPSTSNPSTSSDGTLNTILALAGVLALILLAAAGLRRIARGSGGLIGQLGPGGRAPSGVLSVLARYPIARGTTLVLLKVDRRVLLLCQSQGRGITAGASLSTLCELTDPEDVASILLKTRDDEESSLAQRFERLLADEDRAHASPFDDALTPTREPSDPRARGTGAALSASASPAAAALAASAALPTPSASAPAAASATPDIASALRAISRARAATPAPHNPAANPTRPTSTRPTPARTTPASASPEPAAAPNTPQRPRFREVLA